MKSLLNKTQQLVKSHSYLDTENAGRLLARTVGVEPGVFVALNGEIGVGKSVFAIDTMKTTKDTIKAMQVGAKEMKKELKTLDIDKIEDLQDDFQDYMEEFEEMNEVMGRAWGVPNDVDETDLDAELAGLDEEILLEEEQGAGEVTLPDYLKTPDMPAAPRTQVPDEHAKAEVI